MNYRSIFIKKNMLKKRILEVNPTIRDVSGIYIFTRYEGNFKYAYIGQAEHLLQRLVSHLEGFSQWIDKSILKHGLKSQNNPTGWDISVIYIPPEELNEVETEYIEKYANTGFQLRNKTSGSQGEGKQGIASNTDPKNYRDGIKRGYEKARLEIASLFEKYLKVEKIKDNKLCERARVKFETFLKGE